MKYTLVEHKNGNHRTILYENAFKKLNIKPTRESNKWTDYDIIIYLINKPLNFGEYTLQKPAFKEVIQNNKKGYINRLPINYLFKYKHLLDLNNFNWFPESIILNKPEDKKEFNKYKYWILKSSDASQGKGIVISENKDVYSKSKDMKFPIVVQMYIDKPLLLNNHKFDFRVYVLWINNKIYLNKYFYIRLATEPYIDPLNIKSGLTNLSLHGNLDYLIPSEKFFEMYKKEYSHNTAKMAENYLQEKFSKIIKELFEYINNNYNTSFWKDKKNNYFTLYAFDFIADNNGKMWLLEVNTKPGFADNRKESYAPIIIEDMIKIILKKNQSSFIEIK
jgi:hypothetical protein